MQPPDDAGDPDEQSHALRVLNEVAMKDRHVQLPVVAAGLRQARATWTMPDGSVHTGSDPRTIDDPRWVHQNHAKFQLIPEDAVEVKLVGTPVVAIRLADKPWDVEIPDMLLRTAGTIMTDVIPSLSPYVQP